MAKQNTSKNQKDNYTRYQAEERCVKNRTARLKRYCANNPNDKVAAKALSNGLSYRRKRGSGMLTRKHKEMLQIFASLGYNAKKEMAALQSARDSMTSG